MAWPTRLPLSLGDPPERHSVPEFPPPTDQQQACAGETAGIGTGFMTGVAFALARGEDLRSRPSRVVLRPRVRQICQTPQCATQAGRRGEHRVIT